MNAKFNGMIPKVDCLYSFYAFTPISIYNYVYRVISKVLAFGLKSLLSRCISPKKFGFLEGCQIHEYIQSTRQGLHSIKVKHILASLIKLYLSKAYERARWLYMELLLIHLGFSLLIINWIMGCIMLTNYVVSIHGLTSKLFK